MVDSAGGDQLPQKVRPMRAATVIAAVVFFFAHAPVRGHEALQESGDFSAISVEEAKALAERDGKLLVVDAVADWCVPCKRMDATTWSDESVIAWLTSNAVAVKLDFDEQRELARELGVSALPTVLAFREGEEFDRIVGYKDADDFLDWIEGVARGERYVDMLRAKAGDRVDAEGNVDVRARLDLARTLARSGAHDEATDEFVWLWDNMLEFRPSVYGVRLSFMVSDMTRLAAQYEPAREAFRELRDRYDPIGSTDRQIILDWVRLNQVVDEKEITLAWFDRFKADPRGPEMFGFVERDLREILIGEERYADLARIYGDPVAELERDLVRNRRVAELEAERGPRPRPEGMSEEQFERLEAARRETPIRRFREKAASIYAAMLAAGREDEAHEVAGLLLAEQDNDTARLALVSLAVEIGEFRVHQLQLLALVEGWETRTAMLRAKIEEGLRD